MTTLQQFGEHQAGCALEWAARLTEAQYSKYPPANAVLLAQVKNLIASLRTASATLIAASGLPVPPPDSQ